MDIKFLNQPSDVKLGEMLVNCLNNKEFCDAWIISGFTKDSGMDVIMEAIQNARKLGMNINIIVGVDKKNTSKDMLTKLINYGCSVKIHINTDDDKFETRAYVFKSEHGKSYIFLTAGKLSVGGLLENQSIVAQIEYEANELEKVGQFINKIDEFVNQMQFKILTNSMVVELAETGEIAARIVDRKIPSISELYKKGAVEIGIKQYDESVGASNIINDKEIESVDFEVELPTAGDIKVKKSLGEEVELKIDSTIPRKKVIKKEEEAENNKKVSTKILAGIKDLDYEKMSTFIMQINKIVEKGAGEGEIKIPHSISENMNNFFDYPDCFHMQKDKNGKLKEMSQVAIHIVDNQTNEELIDEDAKLIQMDKYIAIKSGKLNGLEPLEKDIVRIIKISKQEYKCELIRQNTEEYNVWEGFCQNAIKGQGRSFGIV